ncbi:hypothetical protein BaRGS_00011115 [Batillaria attramentaria]|uniref:Uncharacterized protein n=1 Tax=Batillaria attramentaria TaxID=370345 RepID=A0ABD0LE62_9CAEN
MFEFLSLQRILGNGRQMKDTESCRQCARQKVLAVASRERASFCNNDTKTFMLMEGAMALNDHYRGTKTQGQLRVSGVPHLGDDIEPSRSIDSVALASRAEWPAWATTKWGVGS